MLEPLYLVFSRVVPDTDFAGYLAEIFAGYQISGKKFSFNKTYQPFLSLSYHSEIGSKKKFAYSKFA